MINQDVINTYIKTYGTRFTKNQKKRFIKALRADFEKLGYECEHIEQGRFFRVNDYLFGNMKTMKHLIVVPYDTPERKFWHKVYYYPFDGNKTVNKGLIATYVPILLLYIVIFAGVYFGRYIIQSAGLAALFSVLMFLFVVLLFYLMIHGVHNTHNASRYSAAIAAALSLAESFDREERRKVAFVFTDKNRGSFKGAKAAAEYLLTIKKSPNVILLDCLGKGEMVQIAYTSQNRKTAVEMGQRFSDKERLAVPVKLSDSMVTSTPMAYFRKAIVIASGDLDEEGSLCVMGTATGKDKEISMDMITQITAMLKAYLEK